MIHQYFFESSNYFFRTARIIFKLVISPLSAAMHLRVWKDLRGFKNLVGLSTHVNALPLASGVVSHI